MLNAESRTKRLLEIYTDPGISDLTSLIVLRRIVRTLIRERDRMSLECVQKIRELRKGLPFTEARIERISLANKGMRRAYRDQLMHIGEYIVRADMAGLGDTSFGLVADVLCINPVHREKAAIRYEEGGLVGLLFTDRYEDSATYRQQADKSGFWFEMGPLSAVVMIYMTDWMARNSDKLPDPFAPGGPFHGMPTHRMQPNGTVVRQAPALVVHGQDGSSRVVERKPEVMN